MRHCAAQTGGWEGSGPAARLLVRPPLRRLLTPARCRCLLRCSASQLEQLFVDLGRGRAAIDAGDFERAVEEALLDGPAGQSRCPQGRRQLPRLAASAGQLSLGDLHAWWGLAAALPPVQQWQRHGSAGPALHQLRRAALLQSGLRAAASREYKRAGWAFGRLQALRPFSPSASYNLACCHAALAQPAEAAAALRQAVTNGLTYESLRQDPSLSKLFGGDVAAWGLADPGNLLQARQHIRSPPPRTVPAAARTPGGRVAAAAGGV
eukprot:SAG22_NODE_4490_length_1253_cov_1.175910_1_plen_264_part_10